LPTKGGGEEGEKRTRKGGKKKRQDFPLDNLRYTPITCPLTCAKYEPKKEKGEKSQGEKGRGKSGGDSPNSIQFPFSFFSGRSKGLACRAIGEGEGGKKKGNAPEKKKKGRRPGVVKTRITPHGLSLLNNPRSADSRTSPAPIPAIYIRRDRKREGKGEKKEFRGRGFSFFTFFGVGKGKKKEGESKKISRIAVTALPRLLSFSACRRGQNQRGRIGEGREGKGKGRQGGEKGKKKPRRGEKKRLVIQQASFSFTLLKAPRTVENGQK